MIELRPIKPAHEAEVLRWLNNPEICKFNSHGGFPVTETAKSDNNTLRLGIYQPLIHGRNDASSIVGVISLQNIDWLNRSAELAILVGEPQKGHGKAAARKICAHGFKALNLHRIYCGTHQYNIGMQKVAESLGMTLEGRTRQAMFKNGQYADILHYGLLREEFKEV